MDDEKIDRVLEATQELKAKPERWGWEITGVLYGHGKVVVQFVTPKGKAVQLSKRIAND